MTKKFRVTTINGMDGSIQSHECDEVFITDGEVSERSIVLPGEGKTHVFINITQCSSVAIQAYSGIKAATDNKLCTCGHNTFHHTTEAGASSICFVIDCKCQGFEARG